MGFLSDVGFGMFDSVCSVGDFIVNAVTPDPPNQCYYDKAGADRRDAARLESTLAEYEIARVKNYKAYQTFIIAREKLNTQWKLNAELDVLGAMATSLPNPYVLAFNNPEIYPNFNAALLKILETERYLPAEISYPEAQLTLFKQQLVTISQNACAKDVTGLTAMSLFVNTLNDDRDSSPPRVLALDILYKLSLLNEYSERLLSAAKEIDNAVELLQRARTENIGINYT